MISNTNQIFTNISHEKKENFFIKQLIILLIILSSLSLYKLVIFPESFIKLLEIALPGVILFMIILFSVYDNSYRFERRFKVELFLILLAVIVSMMAAYYFHGQDYSTTAITQRFIYFFLFYPLLHVLKPKSEDLIKLMVAFGITYAVIYFLQTLAYPTLIIDSRVSVERGTIRVFMPGAGYLFLTYLYALSRFIKTYNKRYIGLLLISIVIFVLLGTRQVIAAAGILTILSILFSKKVKSRLFSIFLMVVGIIPAYFLFMDVFMAMFELSTEDLGSAESNIRVRAATFFLYEFFPNTLSYFTGNGVPSAHSSYGVAVNSYKEAFGFFQSDIGIIGDYTMFGLLAVIAQLTIYIRIILMKLPGHLEFLKYSIIGSVLTMFLGKGTFSSAYSIVSLCMILYMVDIHFHRKKHDPGYQPE